MLPVSPKKKPINKDRPLKTSVKNSQSMDKLIISELKKENARLQKQVAKLEVKILSSEAAHKAVLAEEKKNKMQVVIQRFSDKP